MSHIGSAANDGLMRLYCPKTVYRVFSIHNLGQMLDRFNRIAICIPFLSTAMLLLFEAFLAALIQISCFKFELIIGLFIGIDDANERL